MRLANIFSDHMVLQRNVPIRIWGWGEPNEIVEISLGNLSAKATANQEGYFIAQLPILEKGDGLELCIKGKTSVLIKDILIGDVWVCSGQSNMGWSLEKTFHAEVEVAVSTNHQIRLFKVPNVTSSVPKNDIDSRWEECTPDTTPSFSAVAYYFGKRLQKELDVPIGLINTSWGGTPAQAWVSREGLSYDPILKDYLAEVEEYLLTSEEERLIKLKKIRQEFLAGLPQDEGNLGAQKGWHKKDFDDSTWGEMPVPSFWSDHGHFTNGVFWFRKEVELSKEWLGEDLLLNFGPVDKHDITYVNGHEVGGQTWADDPDTWKNIRSYPIPKSILKEGKNVIAVRARSEYMAGGICGLIASQYIKKNSTAEKISIAGKWKYAMEVEYGQVPARPEPGAVNAQNTPTFLYNAMIAPIINLGIQGFIWYQGESNRTNPKPYYALFKALIVDWRKKWGRDELPFYFVQLANYDCGRPHVNYDHTGWVLVRDAQKAALELPHTGMAVTIDIGEDRDIHPRNKKDVGDRLAQNALAKVHGKQVPFSGPEYLEHKVEGEKIRLNFSYVQKLVNKGDQVTGFAVAGGDQVFHDAEATIVEGNQILVSSKEVSNPVAVRYGWANTPSCQLYNENDLPMIPFRTDDWDILSIFY